MPKVREVMRRLERDGWELVRQRGSHRIYKHPDKDTLVSLAGKPNHDIPAGTWSNIQKQASWKEGDPR